MNKKTIINEDLDDDLTQMAILQRKRLKKVVDPFAYM